MRFNKTLSAVFGGLAITTAAATTATQKQDAAPEALYDDNAAPAVSNPWGGMRTQMILDSDEERFSRIGYKISGLAGFMSRGEFTQTNYLIESSSKPECTYAAATLYKADEPEKVLGVSVYDMEGLNKDKACPPASKISLARVMGN